jgi:hypothetical protein
MTNENMTLTTGYKFFTSPNLKIKMRKPKMNVRTVRTGTFSFNADGSLQHEALVSIICVVLLLVISLIAICAILVYRRKYDREIDRTSALNFMGRTRSPVISGNMQEDSKAAQIAQNDKSKECIGEV